MGQQVRYGAINSAAPALVRNKDGTHSVLLPWDVVHLSDRADPVVIYRRRPMSYMHLDTAVREAMADRAAQGTLPVTGVTLET